MKEILRRYFSTLTRNLLVTLRTPDKYLSKIALSAIVIILGLLLHILFKNLISRYVTKNIKRRFKLHKFFKNAIGVLTIILVLFIWIKAINGLVLIALVALAFFIIMLRGLIHNIIGFFIIRRRKYFEEGFRVEINGILGDVIDVNPISFTLLEVRNWLSSDSNTGRIIRVPNSIIFEESMEMISPTSRFIYQEIQYTLSFDSNWQEAERIMKEAGALYYEKILKSSLKDDKKFLSILGETSEPIFSLNTDDSGIIVNLRYLVDYENGTRIRTLLQRKILNEFEKNKDINFAVADVRLLPYK